MKKRVFCLALVAILCLSVASTSLASVISPRQAFGSSSMSSTGRTVSFAGYSSSAQIEDVIGVTITLWELRGSTWYKVGGASKEIQNGDYVSTTGSQTVTGGYYYKVTGTHYSQKDGKSYSVTSETASKWIP